MEIVNHRQKMLDIMEINVKGNDNLVIKVISTKNVGEKSKKKESNLFLFLVLPWTTSLKVTFSEKHIFKILTFL